MTLNEAAKGGINRVRRPMWANPNAYARIDLVSGGMGPWLHLYDRDSQEVIGATTPQRFMLLNDTLNDYEEYQGEIDRTDAAPVSA